MRAFGLFGQVSFICGHKSALRLRRPSIERTIDLAADRWINRLSRRQWNHKDKHTDTDTNT